jgi:hypothetical protein
LNGTRAVCSVCLFKIFALYEIEVVQQPYPGNTCQEMDPPDQIVKTVTRKQCYIHGVSLFFMLFVLFWFKVFWVLNSQTLSRDYYNFASYDDDNIDVRLKKTPLMRGF